MGKDKPCTRVLIVDDEAIDRTVLERLIRAQGHKVAVARDAGEATAVGESFAPDVVFVDICMPALDGYQTCEQLRAQPWGKDIAIYALTGVPRAEHGLKAERAGFDGFFHKPLCGELLAQLLSLPKGCVQKTA
jgi:CheY-like chemotaxis protein